MKKSILAALALLFCFAALPASADEYYPRFVIWDARADLYPDSQLAAKADRLPDAVAPGDVVVLQGRSNNGNFNISAMGINGWVKPAPFTDVTLAVCTGDNVNVRSAPKTGIPNKRLQLYKGQSVLVIGKKNLGEKFPWYRIKMFSTRECWVYGQFLSLSRPIEQSTAAELRSLEEAANERGDADVSEIKSAGIKRGAKADLLSESTGLLRGAGWMGPEELHEGDNKYVCTLRIMQERIPSVLHIRVKNGIVSGISFAKRVD